MPKLAAVCDTLDNLAEGLREFYTAGADGKFYLDLDGVDHHPSVLPALQKKNELLGEVKTLKGKLAGFDGLEDPDKAREALRKLPELEAAAREGGASAERIAQIQRDHQERLEAVRREAAREVETAKDLAAKADSSALSYYRRSEIRSAIAAAKGEPELLEHVVAAAVKAGRNDAGEFTLEVLGADGLPRVKDSKLTPLSLGEYVEELKANPRYARAFDGSGNQGSGAEGGGGGGTGGKTVRATNGLIVVDPAKVSSGEVRVTV